MAGRGEDSSPEPDTQPMLVPSVGSDLQRPSIISLGEESRGLPVLISPAAKGSGDPKHSLETVPLHGRAVSEAGRKDTGSSQYTITEFIEKGFIISTEQRSGRENEGMEPKEASSEFVGRAKSTLSPPRDGRRESSITISPTPSGEPISNSSSSSEDESVDMFNRRGHQGSYVLRKGGRRRDRGSSTLTVGEGNADTLEGKPSSVMITPISTLDRSQQGLLDFGSSSSEESADAFERNKNHRSLVLRRGERRRRPLPQPTNTVIANPTVGDDIEPIGNGDPESGAAVALHPGIVDRVNRSLHVLDDFKVVENEQSSCDPQRCFPWLKATTEPPVSPELQQMQRIGFKMFPLFFFPALPKLLQDVWVAVELLVTFFEFVFACVSFGTGGVVNLLVVILSVFNLLLASFDSFLYFVEGGSCVSLFKWGKRKRRERRGSGVKSKELSGEGEEGTEKTDDNSGEGGEGGSFIGKFRGKVRKVFAVGSEVIRISVTELLLYPLIVLDIFELIDSQTYTFDGSKSRINFGLLIVGMFYLVLTIYVIRILMAVGVIVSISRLPKTTHSDYHNLLRKFAIHIIGQILVHITIITMVGTKIDSEVCVSVSDDGSGSGGNEMISESVNASPYLIVTILAGDVIPFLGVAMFFVVNYPALKQFMMGFCIDMMSTIVSEDFASTAFSGAGIKNVKKKASEVESIMSLASVRQQFMLYTNVFSFKKKLSYRLTNPLVMIFSIAYFSLVIVFLTFHALGRSDPCDSASEVGLIKFSDHPGAFVTFIVGVVVIAVVNYQVVLMSVIWLLALAGLLLFVATVPLATLIIAPLIAAVVLLKSCI